MRVCLLIPVLCLCACDGANVSETLSPTDFDATTVSAAMPLSAAPSFGDERGGGVFIDVGGRVVRLRIDGSAYEVEGHPGNTVSPGPASAAFSMGAFSSVVITTKGLFVADNGWLIEPPWRDVLSAEGLNGTAAGQNGVAWLAHTSGLFRIEGGAMAELKAGGESLTGITQVAVAPGADNGEAVWFAQGETLSYAERTTNTDYVIKDSQLTTDDLKGGIVALAGLGASQTSAGELWAMTKTTLWRYINGEWAPYDIGHVPSQVKAGGRILWLQAGDGLYRYDADTQKWGQAKGLSAVPTLLAADASGTAWVRVGDQTLAVSPGITPRLEGLFQNQLLYGSEATITAQVPAASAIESVFFKVDDGIEFEVPKTSAFLGDGVLSDTLYFPMGGLDASLAVKPYSFVALKDGPHTLTVTARYTGPILAARVSQFTLQSGISGTVSWAADIKPLFDDRCAKCHTTGPGRDLSTYELWKTNENAIVEAVSEQRMPADGPLDPSLIQKIARWANGGDLP